MAYLKAVSVRVCVHHKYIININEQPLNVAILSPQSQHHAMMPLDFYGSTHKILNTHATNVILH